jgi:hypothetical protein
MSATQDDSALRRIGSTAIPAEWDAELDGTERGRGDLHLRYLWTHPAHLLCLGAMALVAAVSASPWPLLPVAAVEAGVFAASKLPWLRTVIDRQRRRQRRERAAQLRAILVPQMDSMHTRELHELEKRAGTARTHAANVGESMESLVDERLQLDRLLGTFVRLSIAYRVARESLAMTDRDELVAQISRLQRYRDGASSDRIRDLTDRELTLLRRRLQCLDDNSEELEVIGRDLAAVAEACRLVHERVLSLSHPGDGPAEIERIVSDAQMHDEALGELKLRVHPLQSLPSSEQ